MRTQVGIIGAGPSGLLLAQLLHNSGIESVILEARSRDYVRSRLRAGVLEQGSVDTFVEAGVGDRLLEERMIHNGCHFNFLGESHYMNVKELCDGKVVSVYGQRNITCDMIDIRESAGLPLVFEAEAVEIESLEGERPIIRYKHEGQIKSLECDFVAGCDGYHGISRLSIPPHILKVIEYSFPFGWFAVLADAPPASKEVIYAHHYDGFALQSMRGPERSRLYIQCDLDEDVAAWTDEAFFDEFEKRIQYPVNRGPILQKNVAPVRCFVCEPMRYGRLFLAGDSAHIVPPAGAKGLNLAVADVRVLYRALLQFYDHGDVALLDKYSEICLRRVWKIVRFSWWMTTTFHKFPGRSDFDLQMQLATLRYSTDSRAGATTYAENYVGLPYEY